MRLRQAGTRLVRGNLAALLLASVPVFTGMTAEAMAQTVTVDVRDYLVLQQDGLRLRASENLAIDGARNQDGEYSLVIADPTIPPNDPRFLRILDFSGRPARAPYLFGVRKNFDSVGWRCFANPGQRCVDLADYPPQGVPLIMGLAVTRGVDAVGLERTPGATLIPEYQVWRPFDVVRLDPAHCAELGRLGTVWHRVWASAADRIDFGAPVGVRTNVLVIEDEQASSPNPAPGQIRLEKYFYTQGLGRVREQAFDPRPGQASSITQWNEPELGGDQAPARICPYAQNAF